ncbi:hypothetical protein ACFQL1_11490 [Halomicroarcula sp. GCM10025709]|uniref:hypothetical protein n=1 Tax=Haloarcula TaxID=2237 RepID=UPI0024C36BF5|nr:hypothetical protein [Halomicroarcula sp. YJ-61-S]
MSTEHVRDDARDRLPQDEFSDTVLVAELEPSARGGERAILYPNDRSGTEMATRWLAASVDLLIPVEAVR